MNSIWPSKEQNVEAVNNIDWGNNKINHEVIWEILYGEREAPKRQDTNEDGESYAHDNNPR